ncbi:MAG: ligase-associated DNA damage response endonuclease PdeM [Chitinophagaceae bacterium]|nr:ligase-associated DNA damage response endonuclease PdeM [Chitinophagaceae bacterium]
MAGYFSHIINDEHLVISAERTLFWENESTLIVADLHIGKTGHFRKAGIGVPQQVYKDDLHRLLAQILFFKAERLVIAGDLTHSQANKEMDLFRKWRKDFATLDVQLIKGNHDILEDTWYRDADIVVSHHQLLLKKFLFVHDVMTDTIAAQKGQYIFSGHLHPGIVLRGRGRQALRFPCFYFTKEFCVLPAFSRFTGAYLVEPKKGEQVFAVVEKEIVPVKGR